MTAHEMDYLNDLAGRIEGLARVLLHVIAKLEDGGTIDGPALADGLRQSIVLTTRSDPLMQSAKRTLDNAANALDEARHWRKFRRQVDGAGGATPRKRAA